LSISTINAVRVAHGEGEISDEVLVSMAKSGDGSAYAELSRRHSNKSFHAALRITKSYQDAEDALQNSLLQAFIHIKTFQGKSTFSTWLTRITMNSALMILRKRYNNPAISLDSNNDSAGFYRFPEPQSPMEDPENHYIRKEKRAMLNQAIVRLSPSCRDVIRLQKTRELSLQEIADSLGITLPAVKSRLARARYALRASVPPTLSRKTWKGVGTKPRLKKGTP
jgi:RNA polymerase sigma factor (sigma-70 family)